jgi:hypothetical protein
MNRVITKLVLEAKVVVVIMVEDVLGCKEIRKISRHKSSLGEMKQLSVLLVSRRVSYCK